MFRLLTSVDKRTVTMVLRQEMPDIAVSSIRFHKARADRCVAEVNDQLILMTPGKYTTSAPMPAADQARLTQRL